MKFQLEFAYKKAVQAINFFARKEGGAIDKLKLIKLVWLSDRYHLRVFGRLITNDTYVAMKYGPVGSAIKDMAGLSSFLPERERSEMDKFVKVHPKKNTISSTNEVDFGILSETDAEAMEKVYDAFGGYAQMTLSLKISHLFPEWKRFETTLGSSSREYMSYGDFFEDVESKEFVALKLFNQSREEIELSKKIFEETVSDPLFL